jgi:hypothetical protein
VGAFFFSERMLLRAALCHAGDRRLCCREAVSGNSCRHRVSDWQSGPCSTARSRCFGRGQCGPMKHHDENPTRPSPAFAELVCRDPFSIVGQYPNPDFRLADLSQMPTAIVSEVPTPWLCLQEDLRQAGIDPAPLRRDGRDGLISLPSARSRRAGRRTRALLGPVGVGREPCFPKAA